jgi:hypothetical protein
MNASELAGLTVCANDQACIAGGTTTITLSTAKDYVIAGKTYTQATTTDVQPNTTDLNTGVTMAGISPGYGAAIVIGATSSASTTLRMVQGAVQELEANTSAYHPGAFKVNPQFPSLPDDFCPFGWVIVKVATDYTAGSTYVFGSSNTTATGAQNSAATAHANTFTSGNLPNRPVAS